MRGEEKVMVSNVYLKAGNEYDQAELQQGLFLSPLRCSALSLAAALVILHEWHSEESGPGYMQI